MRRIDLHVLLTGGLFLLALAPCVALAEFGTGSSGGGSGGIDAIPFNPNADNVEFDTADPWSAWDASASTVTTIEAGYPDPTVVVASTQYRVSYNEVTPGWAVIQPGQNGVSSGSFARNRAHTYATNEAVVVNVSLGMQFTNGPQASSPGIVLSIGQTTGGSFDFSNRVFLALNINDATATLRQVWVARVVSGSLTNVVQQNYAAANMPRRVSHVAIWKKSTTYYFYVRSGDTAGWTYLASTTAAITPDRVDVSVSGLSGSPLAVSPIAALNYIRFLPYLPE